MLDNDRKWLIKNFVHFQNGEALSPKSPIRKRILDLLKKNKIDYHKIFDQQNKGVPTLGPERDTRAVEGDREGVIEGEGVRVRERERVREGEGEGEREKEKEKTQIFFPSTQKPSPTRGKPGPLTRKVSISSDTKHLKQNKLP